MPAEKLLKSGEIKRRRVSLGLSVGQAATAAAFKSRQQWSMTEDGHRGNPTLRTLVKIAGVLRCPVVDLIDGGGTAPPVPPGPPTLNRKRPHAH